MSTAEWNPEVERWLQKQATLAGFDTAGIAPVASNSLDAERFNAWIAAGRAGEMDYLKRRNENGILLRSGIEIAIPWARSVIVCAINYNAAAPNSIDSAPPATGWIARYAWSGRRATPQNPAPQNPTARIPELIPTDYHDQLLPRLRQIETALKQRFECTTRCYVDTGPILERAAAAKAGVGWIGKNTCVINQQLGSWLLLGVIVTSIPVPEDAPLQLAPDRCGSCTRCIDACPTDALIAPHQMDASRCIAYLTIEKKGAIPEDLREPIGRQVFGCDICQDVCPWNRKAPGRPADAPPSSVDGMTARPQLVNPPLEWLASMDSAEFKRWFKGSPVERTRRKRLLRNVAIAMGNSAERKFLPQLETWSAAEDPVLAESATWAIARIRSLNLMQNQPVSPEATLNEPPKQALL